MKYLFWDIDGTLLYTKGAGVDALKQAIIHRYKKENFEFSHGLAGRTDSYIVKRALTDLKGSCSAADAAGLLINYTQLLPNSLDKHHGYVLPNVENTLSYLQDYPEFHSALLTGNCSQAAFLKVKHYNLQRYFDYPLSCFGELGEERVLLAQAAFQKLYVQNPDINVNDVIIIGDTPHDIECARSIGARCLIIMVGSYYEKREIEECHPWKIIDSLPDDPAEFVACLQKD